MKATKFIQFVMALTALIGIGGNTIVNAQSLQWAKAISGIDSERSNSISTDEAGNVYITGSFTLTTDFDPDSSGTFNLTHSTGYSADIFICKLDASGNFVWAKAMGGSSNDYGYSITTDAAGNVYTTGYFQGTADFDPGTGTFNLTSAGGYEVFISKLDASGNFVWAKAIGGTADDRGNSIATDEAGNIYTTGFFSGKVDFDPGANSFNLTSSGNYYDIFISKLDASGNFVWAKAMGGTDYDEGFSIATDASGNVYTTGHFYGTADFDPGTASFNLTSVGGYDVFISKLDASGNFSWAKAMGSTSHDLGNSIAIDAAGNVYTTGHFYGTADFDPGTASFNLTSIGATDIFISKLNTSGNFVWAKAMGGKSDDFGFSIATNAAGSVYATGMFSDTVDFDLGAGTFNLSSIGYYDVFISKLDTSGNFSWAKAMGGTYYDYGMSIATDASENVYTTGYFFETVDFDPDAGIFNLSSAAAEDIFVQKMGQNLTTGINNTADEGRNAVTIYPNPSTGKVTMASTAGSINKIEIYNALGEQIQKLGIGSWQPVNNKELSIDFSALPAGIYFLQINTKQGSTNQKLIIQK